MSRHAYIFDAVRTPRARRKGKFSAVHSIDLLAHTLMQLPRRHSLDPRYCEDVVVGCVTQTGEQGWCAGRKGVLAAGWPDTVPATTVNRLCGSGQQAANFVAASVQSGQYELAVAAGLEHMTRCPMFSDVSGPESPLLLSHHPDLVQQGESAEILAERYQLSRRELDEYASESQRRATRAQRAGHFAHSIVSVPYTDESGTSAHLDQDDNIRAETTTEGLAKLKPVFKENGVITAGNASAIVDGAAAMLIGSEQAAKQHGLRPRARFIAMASVGSPPRIMLTGPVAASKLALERAGLSVAAIDLWEINEAFAPVPLVVMRELGIPHEKVNVNGGGISLGHPLGATGVMLLSTALDELERVDGRYALITMCIGLGMGIATVIERLR